MTQMSLRTKISIGVIIAGAFLFMMGVLLIGSAKPSDYFDFEEYEYSAQSADVKSVVMDIGYGKVNITTGTSFKFHAENVAKELFEYKLSSNVVYITYDADYIESNYFAMGDGVDTVFDITLPNKLLEEVDITLGRGELKAKGVSCNKLVCDLSNADAALTGITVNQSAKMNGGSGDCTITACTISSPQISGGWGGITAIKSRFSDMRYEGSFGRLNISGTALLGDSRFEVKSTETSILLPGKYVDYGFSFEKGRGDMTIDGDSDYKKYDDTTSDSNIYIKNGSGDVSIMFDATK